MIQALIHSPFRGIFLERADKCVLAHMNYVVRVSAGMAEAFPNVHEGDFLVSLRNPSTFVIFGRHSHKAERMFRGTFLHQHSVQPIGQSTVVALFDDHGGSAQGGPSRVLTYDVLNGQERTVLPNPGAPGAHFYSQWAGNISISEDGERLIVASTWDGKGYEVRISDGKLLTVFRNVHDNSKLAPAGSKGKNQAGLYAEYGIYYVH